MSKRKREEKIKRKEARIHEERRYNRSREGETKREKKKRKSFGGGKMTLAGGGFGTVHCITDQT